MWIAVCSIQTSGGKRYLRYSMGGAPGVSQGLTDFRHSLTNFLWQKSYTAFLQVYLAYSDRLNLLLAVWVSTQLCTLRFKSYWRIATYLNCADALTWTFQNRQMCIIPAARSRFWIPARGFGNFSTFMGSTFLNLFCRQRASKYIRAHITSHADL